MNQSNQIKKWLFPTLFGITLGIGILLFSSLYNRDVALDDDSEIGVKPENPLSLVETQQKNNKSCSFGKRLQSQCFTAKQELCEDDLEVAKIAWKYYQNNYQENTGLFNAANKYPSTTMWDTGSALAATIAAEDFGLIDKKEFDDKITALIKTLVTMDLFNGEAPNKVYNSKTMKMVTYANKVTPDGIGVSVLDLARLVSWLNTLTCKHPKFKHQVKLALDRWDFSRLIKNGRMYSLKRYAKTGEIKSLQEGRLGYEQYAAKILQREGHNLAIAASYNNENRKDIRIYNTSIATDNRTPEKFHSNNSVVSESYIMDAIENGIDDENRDLINNIFQVQKQRWQKTGIVTAVSEDNINKKPYFIYNTIFSGGKNWVAKTSKGETLNQHKTISNKAAIALALLYPDDEYSAVLIDKVRNAYDPEKGWYSGIYENGGGYNTSTTANTNGVILSSLLYKKYGSTFNICEKCLKKKQPKIKTNQCEAQ